ncbi:MAG: T9SS type A sorting domain-containing protein, partial [Sediminibacterium sp.]
SITQLVTAIDIVELDNRSFHIFPNPASDQIFVESSFHTIARITDVTGRVVTQNYIIQGNQTTDINVSSLAGGYYFLESIGNESVVRERFLIED